MPIIVDVYGVHDLKLYETGCYNINPRIIFVIIDNLSIGLGEELELAEPVETSFRLFQAWIHEERGGARGYVPYKI